MGLGDDIVTRIARVGATHAVGRVMPPAQPRGPAAAREGDIIQHSSFLGALAGAVVGALIGAAVFAAASAVIVGTGGLATAAVLALGTAGTMALGGFISDVSSAVTNMVNSIGPPDGAISQGSPNVQIEGKPAARATVDLATCSKHPPPLIAQGSESVFINGEPAARMNDKLVCGSTIKSGASKVFIGSGQGTYLEIEEEFSGWQRVLLIAVEFIVPPSRGLTKGIGKLFTKTGQQAVVRGAFNGAKKVGGIVRGKTLQCAKTAFKETKGLKRYWASTKKFFTGDPIDVTTGALFDQRTDIELGQTLPLRFTRSWSPGLRGCLGENWFDNFSECALVTGDRIEILTTEGASLHFALPQSVNHSINPEHPDFTLSREKSGFVLAERNNPVRKYFARLVPTGGQAIQCWLLTEHRDRNGNAVHFHHNATHQLDKVTHSDGPELRLFYREDGLLEAIYRTDNGLNDVMARYAYHDNGTLSEADSTQQFHLFYDYNEQGLISRWSDGDQTAVDYTYDAQGRCIHSVGSDGFYPVQLTYESGITRSTTPQGHTTTWHYNDQQQVTQVETPCGHVTRYDYDEWGNLRHQILPEGQTLTLDYLADTGLVTQFTDATGAAWQYHYDDSDRLISMTDPLGRVWWQQYDDNGNTACFIAPDGHKTTLTRNEFGLVIAAEDTEGYKRSWEYDPQKRLTRLFDEENRSLRLGYDSHDRLQRLASGGGALWLWEYDRHHRVALSDRPNNSTERFRHDRHGNLTEWTDARGVQWHIEYGPFDLPVARVDGEGHRWQYRYDPDSLQLVEVINPQGESYRYTLDADGRVITETDYAGTQWHYAYDGNGNCMEKRDALGHITRFEYDAASRMTAMHTPEGTTTYGYDILGRLLVVTAPDSEPLTFEYDEKDRIVKETQAHGEIQRDYPDSASVESTYHPVAGLHWQAKVEANHVGELKQFSLNGEHVLRFERDEDGHEWHRQSDKGFILRQAHTLMRQLTAQRAGRNTEFFDAHEVADIPQPTLAGIDREYRYDAALNLVAANDERQWLRYVVNGNGQVTSVSDGERLREHYQYDAAGYPARRFDGLHDISGERLYQKGHRLRQLGQHLFEYDEAGRMTAMQLWQEGHRAQLTRFRWNSQNQLIGVQTPGGQQWAYRYDAFGRRTEKVCEQSGERTTYLWDGDVPAEIHEYWHNRLHCIRHLVFDGWQLLAQQIQFFTPNPENRRELLAGKMQTQYAVCAPTGEPLALFDEAGHRVWRQPPQSLYGLRLGMLGENPEFNPGLKFAGQWLDDESGLVYNRHRYFSPVAGQYLTPDPIGLMGGENLYAYVQNPTGWIDPLGLACNNPNGYKAGDVDLHGNLSPGVNRAPGHSNTKADNLVQSHHPIQDHWAKKRIKDYKRNSAPATLLHSSSGMPHAQISAAQRTRRAESGGWDKTLKEEFNISYREMIDAGVPKAQARKSLGDAYKYFDGLRGANKNNPFFDI
ncbi:RHS repeat-associated core domain-containing protein [Xenorhabdus ehlersii]|uniref:RHS repeat-associated protein n=1 Tax=Xenorhabdus ehlersii TaxID=290111 RepID=A0A2D0IXH2_9GAMM|nr:RHS repeat-associated core domain-containing protein [Xenorhabdus ehlersii]PHM26623.1 rhsA protein in rhs element [Xenorhabdus ehlersii]RKE93150.1 RHS repeat-associated protein [Xenorhabdus ehlersii]